MRQHILEIARHFAAAVWILAILALPMGPASAIEPPESKPAPAASAGGSADAEMVEVPAGLFFYGCFDRGDSKCDPDERPSGTFTLPTFVIDRTEVTVAAYRRCVDAKGCSVPPVSAPPACNWGKPNRDSHPINCVELADARSYCAWAGKRVPSEVEWEKAARGTQAFVYSWGFTPLATAGTVANIADRNSGLDWALATYDDGFAETAPVGSFPKGASPYGALDMIGNVWEWTDNPYDLQGGTAVRGCSWRSNPQVCRNSNRLWRRPGNTGPYFGFRCVR
jgi:formylglycine-generating enzyme required for sulfatase activity